MPEGLQFGEDVSALVCYVILGMNTPKNVSQIGTSKFQSDGEIIFNSSTLNEELKF